VITAFPVSKNLVANYAARIWAGVATFIFLPAYIRLLGQESFGLVTFGTTVLGVIFILDMGLSGAFARETARGSSADERAVLLRSMEWVYGVVCSVGVIAGLAMALPIAESWLNLDSLSPGRVATCLALMIPSAFLQLWMALYIGGLLGAERHVLAAKFQIGFSAVRSGLVLIPLYFVRQVELVFVWQLVASLICLLWLRRSVWQTIETTEAPRFSRSALMKIKGFAGGMFLIALISAVNTQSDKLVVSKLFSLEQLGIYTLASLLGQIPSLIALPIAITILPRLTKLAADGSHAELRELFLRYSFAIGALSFLGALTIMAGMEPLLEVMTGQSVSPEIAAACRILVVGGVFLATQYMPYHLALAFGHTRTNVATGLVAAVLVPIAMIWGALEIGLVGAALPWLAMNGLAAAILAVRIIPRYLGPIILRWLAFAILLPASISAVALLPARYLVTGSDSTVRTLVIITPFAFLGLVAQMLAVRIVMKSRETEASRVFRRLLSGRRSPP
jgi:O-antigen/teichoic acid export membrane protein